MQSPSDFGAGLADRQVQFLSDSNQNVADGRQAMGVMVTVEMCRHSSRQLPETSELSFDFRPNLLRLGVAVSLGLGREAPILINQAGHPLGREKRRCAGQGDMEADTQPGIASQLRGCLNRGWKTHHQCCAGDEASNVSFEDPSVDPGSPPEIVGVDDQSLAFHSDQSSSSIARVTAPTAGSPSRRMDSACGRAREDSTRW